MTVEKWVPAVLGWWLLSSLVLVTVIDVCAVLNGTPENTVSMWIYQLGRRHPWIYLLVGITLGHIMFPLLVGNGTEANSGGK